MYTALLMQWEVAVVAQCLEYDVVSQWATEAEALSNLKEAVELYLEDENPIISPVKNAHLLRFDLAYA